MSKEVNMAALGKFAEGVNTGNFALFNEVVASDCIDHDPAAGQVPGPEGYRMFFTQMRAAFPDLSVSPDTAGCRRRIDRFRLYPHRDPEWAVDGHSADQEEGEDTRSAVFQI